MRPLLLALFSAAGLWRCNSTAPDAFVSPALRTISEVPRRPVPPPRPPAVPSLLATVGSGDRGDGTLYGVPRSGWSSPDWNWGYAVGTGHDCALICRRRWGTLEAREALIKALLDPPPVADDRAASSSSSALLDAARDPPFEEVKLVLALAWQRGRWDGSDGGSPGGYGEVLSEMARAGRYEPSSDPDRSRALCEDMRSRFRLVASSEDEMREMDGINLGGDEDLDVARRRCAGLVLRAMGFVRNGL